MTSRRTEHIFYARANREKSREDGFTLLELSLAMTFLAFIMMFLVTVILQMTNVYNKTIALSQMDAASRSLMTDLNDGARFATGVLVKSDSGSGGSSGVRLCFGNVSYVINLVNGDKASKTYSVLSDTNFSIKRIGGDFTSKVCNSDSLTSDGSGAKIIPISSTYLPNIQSIAGPGVLVKEFTVIQSSNKKLVTIGMKLSTSGDNAPKATGGTCGNNNYCAFTKVGYTIFLRGVR